MVTILSDKYSLLLSVSLVNINVTYSANWHPPPHTRTLTHTETVAAQNLLTFQEHPALSVHMLCVNHVSLL